MFLFTPDITTKEMRSRKKDDKFNYVLMCNKICGGAHYKMKMIVVVLPENEYKSWMSGKIASSTFKHKYFPVAEAPAAATEPTTDSTVVAVIK